MLVSEKKKIRTGRLHDAAQSIVRIENIAVQETCRNARQGDGETFDFESIARRSIPIDTELVILDLRG